MHTYDFVDKFGKIVEKKIKSYKDVCCKIKINNNEALLKS
jgi:hypothetical protein